MTRASDLARLIGAGATINDGTTITTADNTSQLILTSTDADSSFGPILELARDSGSPADGDAIGQIKFVADNDAGQATDYATINGTLRDASWHRRCTSTIQCYGRWNSTRFYKIWCR